SIVHVIVVCVFLVFFFSSRRRHTRCYRDWSSDVCSSDLKLEKVSFDDLLFQALRAEAEELEIDWSTIESADGTDRSSPDWVNLRSEERRVGKECRAGRSG